MFWRRRKKITEDIRSVAEVAGDQIAPGVGTLALVLGGLVVAGAGAYVLHQRNKNKRSGGQEKWPASVEEGGFPSGRATDKKAARSGATAQQVGREPDRQR